MGAIEIEIEEYLWSVPSPVHFCHVARFVAFTVLLVRLAPRKEKLTQDWFSDHAHLQRFRGMHI